MNPKIVVNIDKSTIYEGEVVELSWSCLTADSLNLTIDNGFKSNSIQLELAGSKKFRLHRSKGKTRLHIEAFVGGKSYVKTIKVRVKKVKAKKAGDVYDYTGMRGAKKNGLKTTLGNLFSKYQTVWNYLPDKKRLAYKVLALISIFMFLSVFFPKILYWGIVVVAGYLFWTILKR